MTLNNASGNVGGTVSVSYDYAALDSDNVGGFQFDIDYDPTQVDVSSVANCSSGAPATHSGSFCTEPDSDGVAPDTVRIVIADTSPPTDEIMPFNIAPIGSVDFDILAPGTSNLTFTNAAAGDTSGAAVTITGNDATIDGAIMGTSFYQSSPAVGSTIDFGSAVVNSTTGTQTITVDNLSSDTDFDITAASGSSGGATINVTAPGMFPQTVPGDGSGGTTVDVTYECTPTARGAQSGSLAVENDSDNQGPSAGYSFDCAGEAPNVMVPASLSMSGLTTDPSVEADATVTNPQDGFTSTANNMTATISSDPDGVFSVSPSGPLSVAPDASQDFTVSCDNAAATMSTGTLTIEWDDPVSGGTASSDVSLDCEVIDEIAEYESNPAVGSTLDFGMVDNGSTSSPMGIDVGNTDTGGPPNADLEVMDATITGPDAGAFALSTDDTPFTVPADTGPDGTDEIAVTCTPTDGSSTFNATLEVTSNDNDSSQGSASPHTYSLTCTGQPDAGYSSTPPAGSTIDFGVLPQGTSSDIEIITATNNASQNDLDLDCTYTGDPQIEIVSPTFPVTIGPGMSQDIESQCTADVPGSFSGTLDCTTNDPETPTVSYDFTCQGAAIDVPTLSQWGLIALGLTLLVGGALAVRLRA